MPPGLNQVKQDKCRGIRESISAVLAERECIAKGQKTIGLSTLVNDRQQVGDAPTHLGIHVSRVFVFHLSFINASHTYDAAGSRRAKAMEERETSSNQFSS